MSVFYGQQNQDTTVAKVNWLRRHAVAHIRHDYNDTLSIISDSLTLCNADQFMTSPNFQNFTVTIKVSGDNFSPSDKVYGYTLYDTYKGIWPLGLVGSYSNGVFNEMHVPDIPVHFVVFTLINGKFYGGTFGATPITGGNYTVTLVQVDPVAFKAQLNSL